MFKKLLILGMLVTSLFGQVKELSAENFDRGIKRGVVVIEFYAGWNEANIVKILESKGYKVKIKSDISSLGDRNTSYGDNNVLFIQWKIDEDFAREEMIKKLSDITI